jgi:hypothetical protein
MKRHLIFAILIACLIATVISSSASQVAAAADEPWVTYEGGAGPGQGKHIALVSGDEEYRSEEALPQLAKILAKRHGFKCTVLFAVDPATGEINPDVVNNIPGLEALKTADLLIVFTRFRDLPDEQMQHVVDYVNAGKPVIGIRTATHAFNIKDTKKPFAKFSYNSNDPGFVKGFGKQVLGETWVNHHGAHGKEGTKALFAPGMESNPILRGINSGDICLRTDVYGVNLPLPGDSQPLLLGQVIDGLTADAKPVEGKKNDPMMPVAWTKTYTAPDGSGKTGRVFTTTMGCSQDLENEAFRRLLVNATYWCLGLESKIPPSSNVELVGQFKASPFKPKGYVKGVKPADLKMQ